jgi:hypothetical protein
VGRRLRKRAAAVLRDGWKVALFASWLHEFDGDSAAGLFAVWAGGFARSAGLLIVLVVSDDAQERLQAAREFESTWDEAWECAEALKLYREEVLEEEGAGEYDLATELLGVTPLVPVEDQGSARRAYPGGPRRLADLAAPQLRLVWPGEFFVPANSAANYVMLAVRVGSADMPLFAHRVASLVGALACRAAAVNFRATGELIIDFHRQQAGRIIASGDRYRDFMMRAYADREGLDILDAYQNLAEGVLRPYGSLLVQLRSIELGQGSGNFRAYATLGQLRDTLGSSSDELVEMVDLALEPSLRNYRAHEDVVRTAGGTVAAVDDDGVMTEIDLNDVHWKTGLLRSYLDGVDVAIQMAVTNVAERAGTPRRSLKTWFSQRRSSERWAMSRPDSSQTVR